ncbi:radical SAM protein [Spirosoma sp.]|uniref:radical SAM protein n=1 Tax=Spirosoma sp. TaxID=1899569 RepID=UPI0026313F49|nr:radical SAM protein [Spirosoma sp.]MCX6212976.1 4Fe-4S cluster-binding domain-containing protein [Spirosoma sp.]
MNADQLICRALVLKVASRCNLNCSYCYVYNQGDRTYRFQPVVMTQSVQSSLLNRVEEYCLEYNLTSFSFIFHGGEPLLAGADFFKAFVRNANRQLMNSKIHPYFFMQTNGTLLSEDWCQLLNELNISVGISIDGDPQTHDKHRVDHAGRGSYALVSRKTKLAMHLLRNRPGIITVIDPLTNPSEVYAHWKLLSALAVGLQLPYATNDVPPSRPSLSAYGDWLIKLFDIWFEDQALEKPSIGLFRQMIELILGIDHGWEHLGQQGPAYFVIETDGGIEPNGSLKLCGDGFTKLGLNVLDTPLKDVSKNGLFEQFLGNRYALPTVCQQCSVVSVCGGGLLANRYSQHNGFNNSSVYCQDLYRLIQHINWRLKDSLATKTKYSSNRNHETQLQISPAA